MATTCAYEGCGKTLEPSLRHPQQRYCSDRCRWAAYYAAHRAEKCAHQRERYAADSMVRLRKAQYATLYQARRHLEELRERAESLDGVQSSDARTWPGGRPISAALASARDDEPVFICQARGRHVDDLYDEARVFRIAGGGQPRTAERLPEGLRTSVVRDDDELCPFSSFSLIEMTLCKLPSLPLLEYRR